MKIPPKSLKKTPIILDRPPTYEASKSAISNVYICFSNCDFCLNIYKKIKLGARIISKKKSGHPTQMLA